MVNWRYKCHTLHSPKKIRIESHHGQPRVSAILFLNWLYSHIVYCYHSYGEIKIFLFEHTYTDTVRRNVNSYICRHTNYGTP